MPISRCGWTEIKANIEYRTRNIECRRKGLKELRETRIWLLMIVKANLVKSAL
jgi:hypothetical protein